ncbi:aminotransferase class IV [Streptomyces sp. NPDC058872]|uniref:aminotransferase class IV n=1 Tax=Streptomyces sp. NPDC058872 TaxID=3346661 RepID=UPI0036C05018
MATVNGAPATVAQTTALALTTYGHFTTLRVADGAVRGLSLHLDRLVRDCAAVFGTPLDPERVRSYVRAAVPRGPEPQNVRVTVFDPALDIGRPAEGAEPHVLVTMRPAGALFPPPLRVATRPYRRDLPEVKHVALFGQLALRRAARSAGFDDVLFTEPGGTEPGGTGPGGTGPGGTGARGGLPSGAADGRGRPAGPAVGAALSEGCTWNVGFVDGDGRVVWPEAEVLPGVTMELLRRARPGSVVRRVHTTGLGAMRAVFATNAAIGVRAVRAVDALTFPEDDPVLAELRAAYREVTPEPL